MARRRPLNVRNAAFDAVVLVRGVLHGLTARPTRLYVYGPLALAAFVARPAKCLRPFVRLLVSAIAVRPLGRPAVDAIRPLVAAPGGIVVDTLQLRRQTPDDVLEMWLFRSLVRRRPFSPFLPSPDPKTSELAAHGSLLPLAAAVWAVRRPSARQDSTFGQFNWPSISQGQKKVKKGLRTASKETYGDLLLSV